MDNTDLNKNEDQNFINEMVFEYLLGLIKNKSNFGHFFLSDLEGVADKIGTSTPNSKSTQIVTELQINAQRILEIYGGIPFYEMTAKAKKQVGKAIFDYLGLDDTSGVNAFGQSKWNELKTVAKRRFEPSKRQICLRYIKDEIVPLAVGMTAFATILVIVIKIANNVHL